MWKISILGEKDGTEITAVNCKLKLVHYLQMCTLTTSGKQLPKWGYEQQEVTCNPNLRDSNAIWNVEENVYDKCNFNYNRKSQSHFRYLACVVSFFFLCNCQHSRFPLVLENVSVNSSDNCVQFHTSHYRYALKSVGLIKNISFSLVAASVARERH